MVIMLKYGRIHSFIEEYESESLKKLKKTMRRERSVMVKKKQQQHLWIQNNKISLKS